MSDLSIVTQRAVEMLRLEYCGAQPRYVDGVNVGRGFPALVKDSKYAYFPDIDYGDKTVSAWQCRNHLSRLLYMAAALGDAEGEKLWEILAAIDFWVDNNFINPNWWHNRIGTPSMLAAICLLLGGRLWDERLEKCLGIISRGSISHNPGILKDTGANLLWGVRITIYYALLTRDEELLQKASGYLAGEIKTDGYEGIKPDYSFHQHGPQLYSCGYGRSFTSDVAKLIYLLSGTKFSLSKEKMLLFESFILEGQRYFTRRGAVDYLAVGREIARSCALSSDAIREAVFYMLQTPGYGSYGELQSYYDSLCGIACGFSGTKYFEHSYFLSHNRPEFHIGVQGAHADFVGTEWGNGENRLGYNLARGGNLCLLSDGREYFDLAPVWDWSKLPGTVSPPYTDEELRSICTGWGGPRGKNRDCIGYAKDGLGALAFRLEGDGLEGYLAYIAFDEGLLILGCGIKGPAGTTMTVDQCLVSEFSVETAGLLKKGAAISCEGFEYTNLCSSPLEYSIKMRTGSWKRVNDAAADEQITLPVFTIYYDEPSDIACAVTTRGKGTSTIAEIYNTTECQGARFASGRSIVVTRNGSDIKIEIK